MAAFAVSWLLFFVGFGLGVAYQIFDGPLLDPPPAAPLAVWAAVLLASGIGASLLARRAPTLTLDRAAGAASFSQGGAPASEMPLAALSSARLKPQTCYRDRREFVRHQVELEPHEGQTIALATYDLQEDADRLAEWLKEFAQAAATRRRS